MYESPVYHIDDTVIELYITFVAFPWVYFTYLSRFPREKGMLRSFLYITFWVVIFASCEAIVHYILGIMTYHNGWNFGWSVILDYISFSLVRLNQAKPTLAYILFIVFTLGFLWMFGFTMADFKSSP